MNREIKFRVWDDENMIYQEKDGYFEKVKHLKYAVKQTMQLAGCIESCKVMQYTGLKDVNKAEVYEADLFEINDGLMEVGFIDGKFILMWADNGTYYCDLWGIVNYISKCGNKYENPELLK